MRSRLWLLSLLIFSVCVPSSTIAAGLLWGVDASLGYLFVSEAKGTPWFSDTEFPSGALSTGGEAWAVGVVSEYAANTREYVGLIPGAAAAPEEQIEEKLSNASFRVFVRIFPGGRERAVAPYLGLGLGPTITTLKYTGISSRREEKDSVVRLSYAVSVGSKLRLWDSPFSAFFEGSFGALGALSTLEDREGVVAPREALDFVCVTMGLGVTF